MPKVYSACSVCSCILATWLKLLLRVGMLSCGGVTNESGEELALELLADAPDRLKTKFWPVVAGWLKGGVGGSGP